ncbi:MAG: hypothetical protein R6V07_01440 [Armatimonadota bacterium]
MVRSKGVVVVLAMMLALVPVFAQEDEATEEPLVNMTADHNTAAEVAAVIEEQTGGQVAVTEWTEGSITGTLENFTVEEAVKSMGQAARTSWMRFYVLESAPPDEPYSASELIAKLTQARSAWMQSLTEEQRQELFGGMRGRRAEDGQGPGGPRAEGQDGQRPEAEDGAPRERGERGERDFGNMFEGPGGAIAPPPAPEGAGQEEEGGRARFARMNNYEDPLRGLLLAGRTDEITLDLTDVSVADALTELMIKSRFLVVADEDLTGEVSLQLEDVSPSEALDAIAEAAGSQWRPVYLVSAPRELTQQEITDREATREERREERFNERWGEFWQQPAHERTSEIQERIERMERMAERMQERAAENPERAQRWQGRMQRGMERRLTQMMNYSERLTPEQRRELKPLLQAMAKINAGR